MSKRSNEDTHTSPPEAIFNGSKPGNWGVQMGHHADIAIYLRVSTEEQNVENQLPIIETYLKANFPKFQTGNPFCDGIRGFHLFWDHESGKHTDRKAWGLLFNRMQSKKYKHIVCWHVDRVSRNIEDFARILRYARAADCTFHFASLHLRSDSPMMEFMCKFFALWGEHEVALREMRQKEGIKRRRDAGLHMGRKPDMTRDTEVFELMRAEPNISIAAVARHFNKGRDWARKAMNRVSERSPPHDE